MSTESQAFPVSENCSVKYLSIIVTTFTIITTITPIAIVTIVTIFATITIPPLVRSFLWSVWNQSAELGGHALFLASAGLHGMFCEVEMV